MIRDTYRPGDAKVPAKGVEVRNLRQGTVLDTEGRRKLILWLEMDATSPVDISIEGAKPINQTHQPNPSSLEKNHANLPFADQKHP